MRITTAQYEYAPKVPLVTVTQNNISYEWLSVPIKSNDSVFIKSNEVEKVEDDAMLAKVQAFVNNLYSTKMQPPNFIGNLQLAAKQTDPKVSEAIHKIIKRTSEAGVK